MGFRSILVVIVMSLQPSSLVQAGAFERPVMVVQAGLTGLLPLGSFEWTSRRNLQTRIETLRTRSTESWKGFSRIHGGRLTPFWAQEFIGVDLVRAELSRMHFPKVGIGMLDCGIDSSRIPENRHELYFGRSSLLNLPLTTIGTDTNHGVWVANLILGDQVGSSENAKLISVNQKSLSSPEVRVVNISAVLPGDNRTDSKETRDLITELTSLEKILVFASGVKAGVGILKPLKEYFFPQLTNLGRGFQGLFVSSVDVGGHLSFFSPSSPDIDILVPSDAALQTRTPELTFFGNSSGSAPLVTGAIADLISVLGDLKLDEAKTLLCHTAIRVSASEQNKGRNGCGLLNAYRAFHAALRLRDRGWVTLSLEARTRLLNDKSIYNFSSEAKVISAIDPDDSDLRKAFLLYPTREHALQLVNYYGTQGLSTNARFYSNVAEFY